MDTHVGKLILSNPEGPNQEFELAKERISIGRALTNDITLDDVRISRLHAKLDYGDQGLTLEDLDSSNGTRVNNKRIE